MTGQEAVIREVFSVFEPSSSYAREKWNEGLAALDALVAERDESWANLSVAEVDCVKLMNERGRAVAERDEANLRAHNLGLAKAAIIELKRDREEAVAERDRYRSALNRAYADIIDVAADGWDNTRGHTAREAIERISAALAVSTP